ncbi:MAG TPA: phenylalanine--tRNA ligase subunit beta [Burkholderiales bacterium]|nr:phenylalanine--tRNA ligase subunit beta [Burkholderiales bacterium]
MQFSEQWLRALVNPPIGTDELAHLLTMSGLEVEHVAGVAPPFANVVAAKILKVQKHPNADRLKVCEVDAGQGATLNIVCGAPNAQAGMVVPCALVGAKLPGESPDKPVEIRAATMRGVESRGMLCSARELGLSQDHGGLLPLAGDTRPGTDVREVLALDDKLLTLKLTPNRADCLSVLGVAREVSALTGAKLQAPEVQPVPKQSDSRFPVKISDPGGCGRFTGRVIRGVDAGAPTPEWMKQRLERAGQRSISALVDVTNYVMLELGRPLHVYDLDKLKDGIDVRFGRKGEQLKLLNEQTVALDETVLAITDASGPIGLAGIMGGDGTKADLDTRNIFLEAAFFFPEAIAGRARRYNFTSDASHRFERGVDFDNNVAGIERATRLILDICGGQAGPVDDTVARLPPRPPVAMRVARARKIIGVPLAADDMAGVFTRLGLPFQREQRGAEERLVVTPPSWRFDLEIEEDLIEEVARVHGFERIPANPPQARAAMSQTHEARRSLHDLRARLAAADYQEVVNYSFVEEDWEADLAGNRDPIRLLNPIASQLAVMRTTLLGGLLANARYNLNRKIDRVRVFEVGRVFRRDARIMDGPLDVGGIHQPMRIAALAHGLALPEQWAEQPARPVDFFDARNDLENLLSPLQASFERGVHPALHPGRSARVLLDGREIGFVGELHPNWRKKYELPGPTVVFEVEADALRTLGLPAYTPMSKFPPVRRDLAVTVPEGVAVQAMIDAMRRGSPAIVQEIAIFDVYRGGRIQSGKKGLAFRVLLQDTQKTLTDEEVDAAQRALLQILEEEFGATLRQ